MLTPLQERIAEIVSGLPEARGFALAGVGGLLVRGLIDRQTRDLDYFTVPGEEEALSALRSRWSELSIVQRLITADSVTSQRSSVSR